MDCNLSTLFLQLWYSKQAVEGNALGNPLGFDHSGQFGPIKVVGGRGGCDHLPNINGIAVGDGNAEDSDLESCFSG
jgi:hypothetical protein